MARSPAERFREKYEVVDGCWLWTGSIFTNGYGCFYDSDRRKRVAAHRWSYEHFVGPIVAGVVDHFCNTKRCVNPAHLRDTTQQANIARYYQEVNPYCAYGHLKVNAHVDRHGHRRCRICRRKYSRDHKRRRRDVFAGRSQ